MTCIPSVADEHAAVPVPAGELARLRESNKELLAALQESIERKPMLAATYHHIKAVIAKAAS